MVEITRRFVNQEIRKCKHVIDEYRKLTGSTPAGSLIGDPPYPQEVVVARAKLDALIRVANFLNDEPSRVTNNMTNEEAVRTATELFINEATKEDFDWFNAPENYEDADKVLEKSWNDPTNMTKGFASLVYFWYTFQYKPKKKGIL